MGSISRHITPLVINSLGGGHTHKHTHTHTQTHIQTSAQEQFQETRRAPGLKRLPFKTITVSANKINLMGIP